MKLTVKEFLTRYAASGLLRTDRPRAAANPRRDADAELIAAFAAAHQGREPADVRELARWMIGRKLLTRYQARQLLTSEPEDLRIGPFIVRQPLAAPPFEGWFSAVAKDGSPVLLLRRGPKEGAAARRRVEAHAAISSPHLQRVEPPVAVPAGTLYVSRLPSGATAAEATPRGGFSTSRVTRIGRQLCEAVASLHGHRLPAPIVDATRVWIAKTGEAILLRDPLGEPASGGEGPASGGRAWYAQPALDNLFSAPERQLDGRDPDVASDLYALGCLLFYLRFGHPPFAGATRAELAEQHAKQLPAAIRSALAAQESGEPLLRVIGHAMAKNRDARFTHVHQMDLALAAVESAAAARGENSPQTPQAPSLSESEPTAQSKLAAAPKQTAPKQAAIAAADSKPSAAPPPTSARRRRRKKNKTAPLILGGLGMLVMFLLILLLVGPGGGDPAQRPDRPVAPPPVLADRRAPDRTHAAADASSPAATTGDAAVRLVDEPGLLWAAPSAGAAPDLSLLPPGAAMIVSFQPNRWLSTSAGEQLADAFAPELPEALQILQRRIGLPLRDVDRLTLAIEGSGGGATQAVVAVWLADPVATDVLRDAWQAAEAQTAEGHRVYMGDDPDGDAYYIPPSRRNETDRFAVGSAEQIARIAEIEGGPLPLPQNLAQLWRGIGAEADLAVLVHPNFLFADGRQILQQYAPLAIDPLRELLIPDASALAVRMDIGPQWYVELRLAPGGGIGPATLAKDVRDAVAELPTTAEQFLLTASPHPSWRAVALRLPAMLRAVEGATRSGVVDGNAVVNLYLPPVAAPNVLLASWLALNSDTLDARTEEDARVATKQSESGGPRTVEQLLDWPLSIRFDQESLESAAETIREQLNATLPSGSPRLEIVLMGGDLQLAGITQNQQIRDFEHREQPLRTVLDDLVRHANPDQTATELSQDAQQLVWALGPDPDDPDRRIVLITTRDQAARKYELPAQFK